MSGLADLGAHGRPHPWWTPVRLLLAIAAVTFTVAVVAKAPCAAGAWWDSPRDYANACHTDLANDYALAGLAEQTPPWEVDPGQHVVRDEQTVPDAALSYAAAVVAQGLTGGPDVDERATRPVVDLAKDDTVRHEAVVYVGVSAVIQLFAFLVGILLLARSSPRPYTLSVLAGAPVIVFTALLGWDMILFFLACAAWWAWRREHAMLAGGLVGVAGAMAFWPLLILPAVALAAIRLGGAEQVGRALGGAVVAWVCCAIPLVVVAGGALFDPVAWYANLVTGTGSVWDVLADVGVLPESSTMNVTIVAGMVVVLMAVSVFALKAFRAPDGPTIAFLLVLGWFWVTKSYEPQYALALLPLAALAWPRWRDLLVWQSAEILFVLGTWWHLGGYTLDSGDADRIYPALIVIRIAAQAWLAARIVLDHRFPEPYVPSHTGRARSGDVPRGAIDSTAS
ncbi:MAG: hypothetical protein ACRDO7_08905 [Nocardioidaceae bacterium]